MTKTSIDQFLVFSSIALLALTSCADDRPITSDDTGTDTVGDGDGDPGDGDGAPGDGDGAPGDGDGAPGDGDGAPGDGDGAPGDGDGAPGDGDGAPGDGDGDPMESCEDGILNQDETDIDCGGLVCGATCEDGSTCSANEDCLSGLCADGLCFTGCLDDAECADLDDDCNVGVCNQGFCEAEPTDDVPCSTGDLCLVNGMCSGGTCMEDEKDCSGLDSQCSVGSCDPDSGDCVADPVNEGMSCDDGDACTNAVCSAGECEGPGVYFYEEFANNNAGWTLDTEWQIGPAVAGCGDPGSDHTPNNNNGIAGVVIGGCYTIALHDFYCLTSPIIDTAGQASVWMTYYRDLYSDYTPWMKNKIEVWNGASWVILFETFGFPGVDDANWTYFGYDVSAHANADMRFRWCHNVGSNGAFVRGGWNVDDVTVAAAQCNVADL